MATAAAAAIDVPDHRLAVCSTGTIGDRLRNDLVASGIAEASRAISPTAGADFAEAIRTTDRFAKSGAFLLRFAGGGQVTIGAAAKGAGMIRPTMATMLAFITTDARIDPEDLSRLTASAAAESFNRISVDGQMSPSDTLLVLASGAGALGPGNGPLAEENLRRFGAALRAVCRWLAIQMVKDGEGAEHAVRVRVTGAADPAEARDVVRSVGESSLFRTAVFGRDPNWGRIVQAVGAALAGAGGEVHDPEVRLDGVAAADADAAAVMGRAEYDIEVALNRGGSSAELWASDLGHEYVRINAEYTT